jgi:molybdate transport system regulatory protein
MTSIKKYNPNKKRAGQAQVSEPDYKGGIHSAPDQDKCLDAIQLHRLEQSFRDWVEKTSRTDVRASRQRILLIFLVIRYTGAKLSEVLSIDPYRDFDFERQLIHFGRAQKGSDRAQRTVHLSEALCREIRTMIVDPLFRGAIKRKLNVDPGFVRRKFYERAETCGITKQLGAPESLRKSRAVELMQNNMPLPAVQVLLGHSTPNLTSSYVTFSEDDIQRVTKYFLERESGRKTSARNSFFGKIQTIQRGDIQSRVELLSPGGYRICTVITNDSLHRLGLIVGKLITAEVKAPWVMLVKGNEAPACSAENILKGVVERINKGEVNTEYIVRLEDGTEVCSIVTSDSGRRLDLREGDAVRVLFNSSAVVLLSD